jgi:SAM-dependent methyltransferase
LALVADGAFRRSPPEIRLMPPLSQHQTEIERNRRYWERKPLLQTLYAGFYQRILGQIDRSIPGKIVELGSGIAHLKTYLPDALATDLFPNPWLDMVCDAYELPLAESSVSHLVLFDVFHHLDAPNAFLSEARRVLSPRGRVILLEPYISFISALAYGLAHPEPIAWRAPISQSASPPKPHVYHAAQGNATRLFFRKEIAGWPQGWNLVRAEAFSCFSYLLSGGYSKPALYPLCCLPALLALDRGLSRFPQLFAGRCLVVLRPDQRRDHDC